MRRKNGVLGDLFASVRNAVKGGTSFADACKQVAKNAIFTTHTPVPAGNEAFDTGLIRKYYKNYCEDLGIKLDQLIDLGLSNPGQGNQPFSLTVLALHLSTFCNGVSQLHGHVSNDMWRHIFKDLKPGEDRIKAITNGIHTFTWMGYQMAELYDSISRRPGATISWTNSSGNGVSPTFPTRNCGRFTICRRKV